MTAALTAVAADQNADVREVAAGALAERDGREVTDVLIGLTADEDVNVGRAAAEALSGRDLPTSTLTPAWCLPGTPTRAG